ncbi:hypothetical protein [Pseudomonas sp. ICMP 561]|uniref:hypothetical protein n=1 Tax=Pseudomonas sp. ICMP 561 TaxID=1718918 RepID=UPI00159BDFB7|nr:hypothetical protein [Pseudomonas sp. ICMP 561]
MQKNDVEIPNLVMVACQLTFTGSVTAFLYQPQRLSLSLVGTAYFDRKDRFKNGRMIRTSDVQGYEEEHGYLIATTLSGSQYVLVDCALAVAWEQGNQSDISSALELL